MAVRWGHYDTDTIDMECRSCNGTGEGTHSDGRKECAEFIRGTGPGSSCHDNDGRLVRYFAATVVNKLGNLSRYVEFNSIRYGFIDWIRIPIAAFMSEAAEAFSKHPIRAVFLPDRRPFRVGDNFLYWPCLDRANNPGSCSRVVRDDFKRDNDLPSALYDKLGNGSRYALNYMSFCAYESRKAAMDDLHRACILYGREQAAIRRAT